jgi:hypothetical protein
MGFSSQKGNVSHSLFCVLHAFIPTSKKNPNRESPWGNTMNESNNDNKKSIVYDVNELAGIIVGSIIALCLCGMFVLLNVLCLVAMYGAIVREYQKIPHVTPRVSPNGPSREQLQQWFDEHPTQAPPAEWYPNGDPWRGITAEEANAMLEDCEVRK